MKRQAVYEYDSMGYPLGYAGYFCPESAIRFAEDVRWDGCNNISLATGSQTEHENLYRTAGGRWVLHEWSQWQGSTPSWQYVDEEYALQWLIRNGYDIDEVVEEHKLDSLAALLKEHDEKEIADRHLPSPLKRRIRQVRDALNKCNDADKIEHIAAILST